MASKKKCFWTVYNLIILNTMLICLYYKQKSVFLQAKTREMETNNIKVTMLEPNKGQIDGVPRNPRWWSSEDVDTLGRSVEETPELMQARPLIVTKAGKKYVVLGGNMRLEAVKRLKWKECPCCVFEDITVEKMEEIVLDNIYFPSSDSFISFPSYFSTILAFTSLPLTASDVSMWDIKPITSYNITEQ